LIPQGKFQSARSAGAPRDQRYAIGVDLLLFQSARSAGAPRDTAAAPPRMMIHLFQSARSAGAPRDWPTA